jgi:poly-gamma-glutamate synthesis protein (capsule biosynthesis protein)
MHARTRSFDDALSFVVFHSVTVPSHPHGPQVDDILAQGTLAPADVWGDTLPRLRGADAVVLNLETALTEHAARWSATPKAFHFKASPRRALPALAAAAVRGVFTANNHTLDYNVPGLRDTLAALDGARVAHAGAGETLARARAPGLFTAAARCAAAAEGEAELPSRPVRVALLGAADHPPEWHARDNAPGTNIFDPFPSAEALAWARAAAAEARAAHGAELVIFGCHYGGNYVLRPPPTVRAFAHALLDSGDVDVFFGHSAHVAQGVEITPGGKPIIYQAGDFVDDYAKDPHWRNDWGAMFSLRFDAPLPDGRLTLREVEVTPVQLELACTHVAHGSSSRGRWRDGERIGERMRALSAELGTVMEVERGTGVCRWRRPGVAFAAQREGGGGEGAQL